MWHVGVVIMVPETISKKLRHMLMAASGRPMLPQRYKETANVIFSNRKHFAICMYSYRDRVACPLPAVDTPLITHTVVDRTE